MATASGPKPGTQFSPRSCSSAIVGRLTRCSWLLLSAPAGAGHTPEKKIESRHKAWEENTAGLPTLSFALSQRVPLCWSRRVLGCGTNFTRLTNKRPCTNEYAVCLAEQVTKSRGQLCLPGHRVQKPQIIPYQRAFCAAGCVFSLCTCSHGCCSSVRLSAATRNFELRISIWQQAECTTGAAVAVRRLHTAIVYKR